MRLLKLILILNTGLFGSNLLSAQSQQPDLQPAAQQYAIEYWTSENGLPNNAIMDVTKTKDGFIWLATFNGLVRFDGLEFVVFDQSNTEAFQTNNLADLYVDLEGTLWIGTNGGGLVRRVGKEFERYDTEASIGSNTVTALAQSSDGKLWIGTKSGLGQWQGQQVIPVAEPSLAKANIYTLYMDQDDRLWVGTTNAGLYGYDKRGIQHYTKDDGLKTNSIRSIFKDNFGNLFVGTDQGVNVFGRQGDLLQDSLPESITGFVNGITQDKDGYIWLGTSSGLVQYGSGLKKFTVLEGLSHNIIQSLYLDQEGNLWIGSYRGGLNRLKHSKFNTIGTAQGLPNQVINVCYHDNKLTWIGTDNGLVKVENGNLHSFNLGSANKNRIRDIYRDSKGRLWICTYGGLVLFEEDHIKQIFTMRSGLLSNSVRRIVESPDGTLWVGTASGLNRFIDGEWESYDQGSGLGDSFVMSLLVCKSGALWVGTDGGGIYQFSEGRFVQVTPETGFIGDIIFNLYQDDHGIFWISSNSGLIRSDGKSFLPINRNQGLVSNSIFQFMEDRLGYRWIYSDKGIMRIANEEMQKLVDGEKLKLEDLQLLDKSDGLPTNQITPASQSGQSSDGKIWISTLKGVAVIDGINIPVNSIPASTKILSVTADGQELLSQDNMVLPASNRRLEIHYAGLSYYAPIKVRYKYKLEEFDKDWIDAGDRRVAFYTNVPPGKYKFLVTASNGDGLWNTEATTLNFQKKAYFYQKNWFLFFVAMTVFFAGGLIYLGRVKKLRIKNTDLSQQVAQRTLDIVKQKEAITEQKEKLTQLNGVKDKLFSVISHDLRGPIAAVGGVLNLMNSGHLTHEELASQAANLNTEVHGLTNLIDNLLSWSKTQMKGISPNLENIQLADLVQENVSIYLPMAEVKGVVISDNIPSHHYTNSDRNMLNLVVRNLLMNAIKFTPQGGLISVSSLELADHLQVTVEDNGVGISPEELANLFKEESHYSKMGTSKEAGTGLGLLLCKEFIEANGGKIWVESQLNKGSSFRFSLSKGVIPVEANSV